MNEAERPAIGSVWKHHSGRLYTVKMYTNLDTTRPEKYPVTIVYEGANGKLWSRPLSDWHRSMTEAT